MHLLMFVAWPGELTGAPALYLNQHKPLQPFGQHVVAIFLLLMLAGCQGAFACEAAWDMQHVLA